MGISNSLPKAWKKINELINGKVNKSQDTGGDGAILYSPKVVKARFSQGWYKIAEIEAYQSTTNTIIEIDGSTGYNEKAISQECSAKIIIRGGNGNPVGLSVACLCFGNNSFITNTSYYKRADSDIYEIFVRFGSVHTRDAILRGYNENRYIKLFVEAREEESASPVNVVESIAALTTSNSPISKAYRGWCKLANGLIIQWGNSGRYDSISGNAMYLTDTFPISFTTTNYKVVAVEDLSSHDYAAYNAKVTCGRVNSSSFNIYYNFNPTSSTARYINHVMWIAVGY